MMTIPTLEDTVMRMKAEITADVMRGILPSTVGTFGELHDYVDANEYGGFCDDALADAMIEHFGGRDADEGMPDGFVKYMNAAQDACDAWLKDGGLQQVA